MEKLLCRWLPKVGKWRANLKCLGELRDGNADSRI